MNSEFLRCRAEIDLDAVAENYAEIKSRTGGAKIISVVKANAYGHGVKHVCPELKRLGTAMFAVSNLAEALEIRSFDRETPILILGYTVAAAAKELYENDIIQVVYSLGYAKELNGQAKAAEVKVKCHIAFDCGMGRIGFTCDEKGIKEAEAASKLSYLNVKGVFTHFPSADFDNDPEGEITASQYEKFFEAVSKLESRGIKFEMKHASNSAAILSKPYARLDAVRAGIILYGLRPSGALEGRMNYHPAMKLKTVVGHVKEIAPGNTVSYGMTFRAKKPMKIATLAIGYADGYLRSLAKDGKFEINGRLAPIVGRVCMDQLMVDITDIPDVKIGDDAVAFGGLISADDLAKWMNTINYEVVCGLSHRVPRVYIKGGETVACVSYLED